MISKKPWVILSLPISVYVVHQFVDSAFVIAQTLRYPPGKEIYKRDVRSTNSGFGHSKLESLALTLLNSDTILALLK